MTGDREKAKAAPEKPQPPRRFNSPRGLNVALAGLTRPLHKKRGAVYGEILGRWATIVGPLLAADSQPERLIYPGNAGHGATLEIAVSGGQALELQHLAPLVIERINGYFGYKAVSALRLRQAPIRPRLSHLPPKREPRPLGAKEAADLRALLDGVEDPKLRQALEKLGRSLRARP